MASVQLEEYKLRLREQILRTQQQLSEDAQNADFRHN
jgi:hypothetical protein